MTRIDLNADLGEGVADDPGLLAVVTSANVACGYHAGDATTMEAVCVVPRGARRAVEMARSGLVDSVCVHGDSPGAVATAHAVRDAWEADGIDVRPV